MLEPKKCQCCGMPLDENTVSKENEDYCMWCFKDGKVTYKNMDELINACIPHMVAQGFKEEEARDYMKQMLPTLNYWKNK